MSCFLSALLHAKRVRRGTRVLGTSKQAVLVLRWFLDDARMCGLARDNAIGLSTAYAYREEGIAVLAAAARGAAGGQGRRVFVRDRGRHSDLYRPDRRPRPHPRGGSVVVG